MKACLDIFSLLSILFCYVDYLHHYKQSEKSTLYSRLYFDLLRTTGWKLACVSLCVHSCMYVCTYVCMEPRLQGKGSLCPGCHLHSHITIMFYAGNMIEACECVYMYVCMHLCLYILGCLE